MSEVAVLLTDWQFWTAVFALTAIVLSQLPPVSLWFRSRRLDVEVHSRVQITHKVGNPNVAIYLSVANVGGRTLRVGRIEIAIQQNGRLIAELPAQSYFEAQNPKSSLLLVPFTLKPGETWGHITNFFNPFDRPTEKLYREAEANLSARIRDKLSQRALEDKQPVEAEDEYLEPFRKLFDSTFIWTPGEYVMTLAVTAKDGVTKFSKQYRFTLFESDSKSLSDHTEDYKFGAGLYFDVDTHQGIFVPLNEHVS